MPSVFDSSVEREYLDLLAACSANTKLKVLIFGPNTKAGSSGARLRKYIAEKCQSDKIPIYAERKRLVATYTKMRGKYSDFCDYEKKLAQFVDAIIIIPGSAGSLVELGMLVHEEYLHKILVLFDKKHSRPGKPSFIELGPRRAYELRRALVHDVDYLDQCGVLEIVEDFLSQRQEVVFAKKRLLV